MSIVVWDVENNVQKLKLQVNRRAIDWFKYYMIYLIFTTVNR